jgi:putative endonuclease
MRWHIFDPRTWKGAHDVAAAPSTVADTELAPHLLLGRRGEALAAEYLLGIGYLLVASNFVLPVGRSLRGALVHAEIDLIAYEGATLCFIEVKTRSSSWFTTPEANVDLRKQRQITRAARVYRRLFDLMTEPHRYDVVSIVFPPVEEERSAGTPQIKLLRNFWSEEKFRKRRWRTNSNLDF